MSATDGVFNMADAVPFTCPMCGRQAFASTQLLAVVHDEPPCPDFVRLDVTRYMRKVNYVNRMRRLAIARAATSYKQ